MFKKIEKASKREVKRESKGDRIRESKVEVEKER
jgi:hypothetical protein